MNLSKQILNYILIAFFCFLLLVSAVEVNLLGIFGFSPTLSDIKRPNMRIPSELYTSDGKLIGRYYRENRIPVEYKDLPQSLIKALIATEDARFHTHFGIDFLSVFGSIKASFGGEKRGASTLTQQLAKNLYRTRTDRHQGIVQYIPFLRTAIYKLKEWITALKLESVYSKNEILTLYLNTVPFGNNTFGIKTASKLYFNKDVNNLKIEECALLVGMLKATSTYDPIKNRSIAFERRNIVLAQMLKYGYLNQDEFEKARVRAIQLNILERTDDDEESSYLRDAVARWLEEWCESNGYSLYESGLKVYTTINSRMQNLAEEAVSEHMKSLQRRLYAAWGTENPWRDADKKEILDFPQRAVKRTSLYTNLVSFYGSNSDSVEYYLNKRKKMRVFTWNGSKDTIFSTLDSIKYYAKFLNAGMMTLDPFNGHIKVWVGGIDHRYFKYDHVNQAKRQPGSTFKPFAYLTALDNGYAPCDKFTDKPIKIEYEENGIKKIWEPKNADYRFSGREMSLRWAMAKSCNSITAQITQLVGWNKIVDYAYRCGIESKLKPVPSVALGSNEVSLLEMVKSYGTFLNKGLTSDPILVTHIEDSKGNILAKFSTKSKRAISEEIAWLMLYMFRGGMEEPEGTSQALWEWDLWKKGNQIGGKTGTSSNYADGWYMGFTKDLITGIWVGADERSVHFKNSETGEASRTALPIFGKFMEKVYRHPEIGYTEGVFPKPTVKIHKDYYCPSPRIKQVSSDSIIKVSLPDKDNTRNGDDDVGILDDISDIQNED